MRNRTGSPRRSGWMSVKVLALLGLAGGALGIAVVTNSMNFSGVPVEASSSSSGRESVGRRRAVLHEPFFKNWESDWCVDANGNCIECPTDPESPPPPPPPPSSPPSAPPGPPTPNDGSGGSGGGQGSASDWNQGGGDAPIMMFPVELNNLSKMEKVVDITVALPGEDFIWARQYSSFTGYLPQMLGYHWFSNALYFVDEGLSSNREAVVIGQPTGDVHFIDPDDDDVLRPRGMSSQEMRREGQTLDDYPGETGSVDVWRLTEPGKWEIDFYDAGSSGSIPSGAGGYMLQYRDAYGNTRTYEYTTLSNISSSDDVRLSKIYLNGTEDPDGSSDPSDAVIELTWFDIGVGNPLHDGHLDRIEVVRKNGGATIVTQWVDYDYASELRSSSVTVSDDVADSSTAEPLLIQSSQGALVDDVPISLYTAAAGNYYVRFSQYRYHNAEDAFDNDYYPADPVYANGREGILKSIILPEQIEYLAQQLNDDATGSEPAGTLGAIGQATYKAAEILLGQDDDDDDYGTYSSGGTGITPIDLASKILSYNGNATYEYEPIAVQWLQADCGCGGGSSSSFRRFEYTTIYQDDVHSGPGLAGVATDAEAVGKTVRVEEYEGTGTTLYREYRYDMVFPRGDGVDGGSPYLVAKALRDHSLYGATNMQTDDKWWVWWYDRHFGTDEDGNDYGRPGDTYDVYSPSAMGDYTPATATAAASYTPVTDGGLIHRHEYNGNRHRIESSTGTLASSSLVFKPYQRITYPTSDTTAQRTYLATKLERNRTGEGWSTINVDDVETITYSYDFSNATTTAMRRRGIAFEAELVSENGPGIQTYETVMMYDDRGQFVWSADPNGCMTYREYDQTTGVSVKRIDNADPTGTNSTNPAFVHADYGYGSLPSGWGTNGDGGDLESTSTVDLLGRWVSQTSPGGVERTLRREVAENSELPGVAYMSLLSLPHKLAAITPFEFGGPASRVWLDAARKNVRMSTFSVSGAISGGTSSYDPSINVFALNEELTRSVSIHNIRGQMVANRKWHDISETSFTGSSAYNEVLFDYDSFGRLVSTTDPVGSKKIFEYDAIDRRIAVKSSSIESGASEVTVANYFYDNNTSASQGIGNGSVSRIDYYTAEPSSGGLSDGTRTTYLAYDYRDRLVKVENSSAPHSAYEFDNLNRLTRSGVFSAVPSGVDNPVSNRGRLFVNSYSQRGLEYKKQVAINPSVSSPDFLESNAWFDELARVIKSHPHSGQATKLTYDALGRVTDSYVTDARFDAKAGNTGNHGHADDVTSDTVFEQTSYTYSPDDSLLDLVERRVRNHDATAYGAIASGDGVTSWTGRYYDDADRRTHIVGFGTTKPLYETGGTAPSWPPVSAPSATSGTYDSDSYIVSETVYNDRGFIDERIDPNGVVTKYLYDDAERTIAKIGAYDDASLASTPYASGRWQFDNLNDDKDRVTSYVYSGVDDVVRMVAHRPNGSGGDDAQVTEYTYGVTAPASPGVTDSLVYNNRLLLKAAYPDETTGSAGSTGAYEVSYSYNALGELRSVTDQNGTLHEYERDTWGRVTADRIDAFINTDLDQTVQRIEVAYDDFGRVDTIESLDAATGTASVLNGVTYEYTPLWQIEAMHQDMDGVASTDGTGGTETVEYVYTTSKFDSDPMLLGSHNYTRLSKIAYPSDTVTSPTVGVSYGHITSPDNAVSRISAYGVDGFTANLVYYEHLGFGRVAEVDYVTPDVQLDRTFSHEGKRNTQGYSSQTAGLYPGWDRFGRVRVQAWMDGGLDTIRPGQSPDPNVNVPGKPPLIEELQTYDRASIRTGKLDARPGAKRANRDYDFGYDDLDRLTSAKRGSWDDAYNPVTWTPNPTGSGIGNSEAWTYDALGNWDELLTDGNHNGDFADTGSGAGYTDLAETRTHNMANELDDIDEDQNVGGVDLSFLYDDSGNRTKKTYVSGGGHDTYTYDAWNRLVKIERTTGGGSPTTSDLSVYAYNGQHHRIKESSGGQTREMYYSGGWRLLEEHVDEPSGTTDREIQYFWGKRYIDDAVMHRIRDDSETTWSLTRTFYHLTDPMYSTLAIIDGNGTVKERVHYSSYGVPTAYRPGDVDGDGVVNTTDIGYFKVADISSVGTNSDYTVELDIDGDGDVDSADFSPLWLTEANKSTLGAGVLSDTAVVDNRTGYDGYRWELETQLWHVRHRAYDAYVGRWLQRDPLGYVDSPNVYEYSGSSSMQFSDPTGLSYEPRDPNEDELVPPKYYDRLPDGTLIGVPSTYDDLQPIDKQQRSTWDFAPVAWTERRKFSDWADALKNADCSALASVISCHGGDGGPHILLPINKHGWPFRKFKKRDLRNELKEGWLPEDVIIEFYCRCKDSELAFFACGSNNKETDDAYQDISDLLGVPVSRPSDYYWFPGGPGRTTTPNEHDADKRKIYDPSAPFPGAVRPPRVIY